MVKLEYGLSVEIRIVLHIHVQHYQQHLDIDDYTLL